MMAYTAICMMHYWVRYHGFFSQKRDFFLISNFSYAVVTFLIFLMLFLYLCGHAHFPFAAKINVLNYFNLLNEFNSNKVKMDYLLQAIYFIDEKEKKKKKKLAKL